ncbi:bifunctional metallophosphatase/5'-nucleotidase [Kroppenstedtia eburnea]|uniref:5'-nucleotidase n=1 Tax=Kroppenstedtia eburnea TaxID=714067 RepID=A0A1N7NKA0_9BACL|nr:5'-nucleotidase C-terminal domain-containing protein [Kroppenstedtia eburnea]EGK08898.1 endonuclease YhcR [Desmospora sp. 8437]QKI80995.1 bifunctional metallophosphatase/5'-nucleotidase [Kroppenstedtia eburnea]SIS98796.1 5'-nucleotidase [Kroppenstedtia eburnea]
MRNRWKRASIAILLAVALAVFPVITPEIHAQGKAKGKQVELHLLSINDFHGQLNTTQTIGGKPAGRADYLAAYLKERQRKHPNTWLVHAGDVVGASPPVSALLQDEPTVEILNKLGFDVGTLGNHEFDEGVQEMMRLIHGGEHEKTGYFSGADFPYTAANVVWEKTGKPILPPHVIKRVKGIPVGFIGVVTKETPTIVTPTGVKGVKFTDEAEAINREVKQLKKKKVKAIIVLAHEGGFQDSASGKMEGPIVDITKKLDNEVDVVIAGHSHTHLNGMVDGKLVVQAYSYGSAFADIDLTLDHQSKDIVKKKAEVVTTYHEGIQPDPEIGRLVEKYEEKVAPLINREVGKAAQRLTRDASPAGESAMGNLIADSQRWKTGTEFALMNPGGIRADLEAGAVTWGDLFAVQPFGNDLVTMTLTGDQLKRVLEQQWQQDRPRFLQISGFTYTWDDSRPAGDRVLSLQKADGTPIDPQASYTVTANSFIAAGGDNFTVFTEAKDQVVGPVDLDALVDYVEQLPQPFSATIEGRIQKAN